MFDFRHADHLYHLRYPEEPATMSLREGRRFIRELRRNRRARLLAHQTIASLDGGWGGGILQNRVPTRFVQKYTRRARLEPSGAHEAVEGDTGHAGDLGADSYGQSLGDPSPQELARDFHLDDTDHTQIVEQRGDANRLGFALQLTTVRVVGTFLDDPTAVPPAVLATMSRQLGIDTTTDVTGYRAG